MSYARFGQSGSDVYVFLDVSGYLSCCGCDVTDDSRYYSTDDMLAHLEAHRDRGDTVPQACIDGLLEDKIENDEWIRNYDPVAEQRKRAAANVRHEEMKRIVSDELGYEHPGPEDFDWRAHEAAWRRAGEIYDERHDTA